jgi:hypothetical protein
MKDLKQTLPRLSPEDDSELGDPRFDRSYWSKFDVEKNDFDISRMTSDELNGYVAKLIRMGYKEEALAYLRELSRRLAYINKSVAVPEGYGAGRPEDDRLHIHGNRWQIRSKDAPKTPKMEKETVMVSEVITEGRTQNIFTLVMFSLP